MAAFGKVELPNPNENLTCDNILQLESLSDIEGRWIPFLDSADSVSPNNEALNIISKISPSYLSCSYVALDGDDIAFGMTGLQPPPQPSSSSAIVWLWTEPLRRQIKRTDPPSLMILEVSGVLHHKNLSSNQELQLLLKLSLNTMSSLVQRINTEGENDILNAWAWIHSSMPDVQWLIGSSPQFVGVFEASESNSKKLPKAKLESWLKYDENAFELKNAGVEGIRECFKDRNAVAIHDISSHDASASTRWVLLKELLLSTTSPRSILLPSSIDDAPSHDEIMFSMNGFHLSFIVDYLLQAQHVLSLEKMSRDESVTLKQKFLRGILNHYLNEAYKVSMDCYHKKALSLGIEVPQPVERDGVAKPCALSRLELWTKIDECCEVATDVFHMLSNGHAYKSSMVGTYLLVQEDAQLLSTRIEQTHMKLMSETSELHAKQMVQEIFQPLSSSSSSNGDKVFKDDDNEAEEGVEDVTVDPEETNDDDDASGVNWAENVEAASLGMERNDHLMNQCSSRLDKIQSVLKEQTMKYLTVSSTSMSSEKESKDNNHWKAVSSELMSHLIPMLEEPSNKVKDSVEELKRELLKRLEKCKVQDAKYSQLIQDIKLARENTRSQFATEQGEMIRNGERSKQELLRTLQEVEMELSEVASRSERIEVLRRKKVTSAVTRANDARRRAVVMNAKVAEIQAVTNAKVNSSKAKTKGMESMALGQMQLSSLIRERELLEAHAVTLEAHLKLVKTDQDQFQVKATEVQYQCSQSLTRRATLALDNENHAKTRDHLEDLVLKLKLYTLGGINAVKMGRPPHTTLPSKLVAMLDPHERQCLDEIFLIG